MVLALADRWKKLPEEIENADPKTLRYLEIVALAREEVQ